MTYYYKITQIERLFDGIISQITSSDNKFMNLKKYILDKKEHITMNYTTSETEKLLDDILQQIPVNDNKFMSLKKYILNKKEHIHHHI